MHESSGTQSSAEPADPANGQTYWLGLGLVASMFGIVFLFNSLGGSPSFAAGLALGEAVASFFLALPVFVGLKFGNRFGRAWPPSKAFNALCILLVSVWAIVFVILKNVVPHYVSNLAPKTLSSAQYSRSHQTAADPFAKYAQAPSQSGYFKGPDETGDAIVKAHAGSIQPSADPFAKYAQAPSQSGYFKGPDETGDAIVKAHAGSIQPSAKPLADNAREQRFNKATAEALVARVYPDWIQIVQSDKFHAWFEAQSPEVQALAFSPRGADAVAMIAMFKKDHPNSR